MPASKHTVPVHASLAVSLMAGLLMSAPGFAEGRYDRPLLEVIPTDNDLIFTLIQGLPTNHSAAPIADGQSSISLQAVIANTSLDQTSGGESLLIDAETHRINWSVKLGLGPRLDLVFDGSVIDHSGGFADRLIEDWHSTFGLPDGNRNTLTRDDINLFYDVNGTRLVGLNQNETAPGPVNVSIGWTAMDTAERSASMWVGAKLPTGDSERMTGSEKAALHLRGHYSRYTIWLDRPLAYHVRVGALFADESHILSRQKKDGVVFGSATLAWQWHPRLALQAQLDGHTAAYDSELSALGSEALQLSAGLSWRWSEHAIVDFSLSEDVAVETAPDITLRAGLRFYFPGST